MVTASEIQDSETFERWLKGRPRGDALLIGQRVACRVLPIFVQAMREPWARAGALTALTVLRLNLNTGVAHLYPSHSIRTRTNFSTEANPPFTASAAAEAFSSTAYAFSSFTSKSAIASIDAASYVADDAAGMIWRQIKSDAIRIEGGGGISIAPLWSDGPPDWFTLAETRMRTLWSEDPTESWTFWVRWWHGVLTGRHVDWELQRQVALIPDDIWRRGPDAVAKEIARIELEFGRAASPNAEDLIINSEGNYDVVPRSDVPAGTLQDARDRIADTIRQIRGLDVQNHYVALSPEADVLQDALDRYGDNALRLYEACQKVRRHVGTHVLNGVLPERDNVVTDVAGDLQNTADDIYSFDSEVRRTVDARVKLRFERMDSVQKEQVEHLAIAVAERSTPQLAAELREDAAVVRAEREPNDDTAVSRYRLGSRLVRVASLGGQMFKDVTEALRWVGGVAGGVGVVAALLLLLLGLL